MDEPLPVPPLSAREARKNVEALFWELEVGHSRGAISGGHILKYVYAPCKLLAWCPGCCLV